MTKDGELSRKGTKIRARHYLWFSTPHPSTARLAPRRRDSHWKYHASERMSKVTLSSNASSISAPDRVSDALKWILLAVAILSFVLFAWATVLTYDRAPP